MGWNDHMTDLETPASEVAVKAGALKRCPNHTDVLLDADDPDAVDKAHKLAAERWKDEDLDCTEEEFVQAVDEVIESAGEGCPQCDN